MRFLGYSVALMLLLLGCRFLEQKKKTLRIIHAGSFGLVITEIIEEFRKEYPEVQIYAEAWGSKDGARQITELRKTCDVYISSDIHVIKQLLMPQWAQWYIPFARNEMVIAYSNLSRYAQYITNENWYEILLKPDVRVARSDPDADPCGARTVIMLKLADKIYQKNISEQILRKSIPFMRPKETELIPLLQTQAVDYVFIYLTLALQHNLKFVHLSDSLNLSDERLSDFYASVHYQSAGREPSSSYIEAGSPIVYGVTIPTTAQNKESAIDFIAFMLHPEKGGKIIQQHGHKHIHMNESLLSGSMPDRLKNLLGR